MATRRRIGVSAASTEAARRQLMQPVTCWERVLVTPDSVPSGSSLKIWKWVKTDKVQHFSDDEGGVDEPLAPLPDEPEVIEGEEEIELDETQNSTVAVKTVESTPAPLEEPLSKPASPKPQLSLTVVDDAVNGDADVLDASLKPLDDAEMQDIEKKVDVDIIEPVVPGVELDLSVLGPDGIGLDNPHDLSQLDASDGLVGGPLLDETVDPFAPDAP